MHVIKSSILFLKVHPFLCGKAVNAHCLQSLIFPSFLHCYSPISLWITWFEWKSDCFTAKFGICQIGDISIVKILPDGPEKNEWFINGLLQQFLDALRLLWVDKENLQLRNNQKHEIQGEIRTYFNFWCAASFSSDNQIVIINCNSTTLEYTWTSIFPSSSS